MQRAGGEISLRSEPLYCRTATLTKPLFEVNLHTAGEACGVLGASGGVSCERVLRGSGGVSVLCLARCLRGAAGVEVRDLAREPVLAAELLGPEERRLHQALVLAAAQHPDPAGDADPHTPDHGSGLQDGRLIR